MKQHVLLVDNLSEAVGRLQQGGYDRIFVLTDTQTERLCRPLLGDSDFAFIHLISPLLRPMPTKIWRRCLKLLDFFANTWGYAPLINNMSGRRDGY